MEKYIQKKQEPVFPFFKKKNNRQKQSKKKKKSKSKLFLITFSPKVTTFWMIISLLLQIRFLNPSTVQRKQLCGTLKIKDSIYSIIGRQ